MAYPAAGGAPAHSKLFIPELWSGKTIDALLKTTVFEDIVNRDHESEIKGYGDTVHIDNDPTATIKEYFRGMSLDNEIIETDEVLLEIDTGYYWSATCEDVEYYQTKDGQGRLNKFTDNAGRQMAIEVDRRILNEAYIDVDAANSGLTAGAEAGNINLGTTGAPFGVTKNNIIDKMAEISQVLDEQNVAMDDRFIVVPSWMYKVLKQSDLKNYSFSNDNQILRNGKVMDNFEGFKLYKSNNYIGVVDGLNTAYHVIAGHRSAITYAMQIDKMETLRSQDTFGDIVRSLLVFGFVVQQPKALVDFYCYEA